MQRTGPGILVVPQNGKTLSGITRDEMDEAVDSGDPAGLLRSNSFKLSRDVSFELNSPELFFHGIP